MKTRKKAATLVVIIMAMIGAMIGASPSAQAKPASGTWEVSRTCAPSMGAVNGSNTSFDGTIKFKYRLDFVSHQSPPGGRDIFTFTPLSASYIGDNYQTGYPSLNFAKSGGWAPVYGTFQNGSNPVAPANYLFGVNAPTSPQFLSAGVSPAVSPAWAPTTIYYPDGGPPNNLLRLNFGNQSAGTNPCIFYIDMSHPDAPTDFMQNNFLADCGTNGDPGATFGPADYNVAYTLFKLDPGQFTVHVTGVHMGSNADVTQGYYQTTHLELISGGSSQSLDPVGGMQTYQRDGENVWETPPLDFPTVTLPYILGETPTPQIKLTATGNDVPTCTKTYFLGTNWGTPGQSYDNTVDQVFNDCSGTGHVNIQSFWEWDANSEKVRIKRVSIANDSAARLVMPTLVPGQTIYNNPLYRSDGPGGTINYSDASSIVSRNINPHTIREFDVGGSYWDMILGPYAAPSLQDRPVSQIPVMEFSFTAQRPNGTGWVTCESTVTATLQHIEATSLRL
jgi:hypothetical protein